MLPAATVRCWAWACCSPASPRLARVPARRPSAAAPGAGAIDGGVNGLALAIHEEGRGRALNLLHLFFAAGALGSPIIVGQLVERGVAVGAVLPGHGRRGARGLAIAAACRADAVRDPSAAAVGVGGSGRERPRAWPLPGAPGRGRRSCCRWCCSPSGIGCYVASEVGVSNWIVRFLDEVHGPTRRDARALGVLGRARAGPAAVGAIRRPVAAQHLAAIASVVAGVGGDRSPSSRPHPSWRSSAFAVAGFASGPIFPVIVASAATCTRTDCQRTTGILTGAAVVGGTLYPPLVGLMSARVRDRVRLAGRGLLSFLCAIAILAAARMRRRRALDARSSVA